MAKDFNPIEFTFRSVKGHAGASQREIFRAALHKVIEGEDKPGWEIGELGWRNPETQKGRTSDWQFAPVSEALGASSAGFKDLLVGYLEEEIEAQRPAPRRKPRPAPQYKGEKYARRIGKQIEKHAAESAHKITRHAAAKKGWITRRANQRKRSRAAKKGWRTRRGKK